ncbi:MAG: acyltransferase [Gammaproteobacteria bacterium]|nr:acyltransferase [Gammaproteobacteria bacterium]
MKSHFPQKGLPVTLPYIHTFRGIAIIFIVLGHALYFQFDWSEHTFAFNLLKDVLSNGTVLFVFISGYLFKHLHGRYTLSSYYKNKFKNLVLPYLILSVPAIAFTVLVAPSFSQLAVFHSESITLQVLSHYLVGGAHVNYALWFMPMIIVVILLAPLLATIFSSPQRYWLVLPLLVLSLLIHRSPVPIVDVPRHVIYFIPVFIIGMWVNDCRDQVEGWLERNCFGLLLVVLALIAYQFNFADYHGSLLTEHAFDNKRWLFDFELIQKLLFCGLFIGLLRRYESLNLRVFDILARYSFTIFFCHIYIFVLIEIIVGHQQVEGNVLLWLLRALIALSMCCLIGFIGQKLFGRYSRQIVAS